MKLNRTRQNTSSMSPTIGKDQVSVALLTNIPSPYRLPFLRELSQLHRLHVVFDVRTEVNRHWEVPDDLGFASSFAGGVTFQYMRRRKDQLSPELRELHVRYGVLTELKRLRPDVVVSLEFGPRSLLALLYCKLTGTPLIIWSEGTMHTEGWVGRAKTILRRFLVHHSDRFWVNGAESRDLITHYGGSNDRVDQGMTGVDTEWFADNVLRVLPSRVDHRTELGIGAACFIFVGQLTERKGLPELLAALDVVCKSRTTFTFLLAGEGHLRPQIESWQHAHPECDLRLLGHLPPDTLIKYYAVADIFVLPTLDDNWSLATLEAAVAGLPQVFSRFNGATCELSSSGVTGRTVNPLQTAQFAEVLLEFADHVPERLSQEIIRPLSTYYSPKEFAARAGRSITAAATMRRERPPRSHQQGAGMLPIRSTEHTASKER
jgi:glycosyltransferase involved in cell wall biosynthesis